MGANISRLVVSASRVMERLVVCWIFGGGRQPALLEAAEEETGDEKDGDQSIQSAVTLVAVDLATRLYTAAKDGDVKAVDELIQAGADPNWRSEEGDTPLYWASLDGHTEVVDRLLRAGADVNQTSSDGNSPLHVASYMGLTDVVDLLLRAGGDVDQAGKEGETPLFWASCKGHTEVVDQLLRAGATLHLLNKRGWSPVHAACRWHRNAVVHKLLSSSESSLHIADKDGYLPLHLALLQVWQNGCSRKALKTLQLLVGHGGEWDGISEKITQQDTDWPSWLHEKPSVDGDKLWFIQAPAVRLCFQQWILERMHDIPLTDVPFEEVRKGIHATKTYLTEIAASKNVKIRCKVCVVGPSGWGKTTLIQSLTNEQPSLVHIDNRTIGIDLFKLKFSQTIDGLLAIKEHEATFWDFAGQDAYQVAHSLFFSARTLYVVCIDLEAFVTAYMQAQLMTDTESEFDQWMNDFIEIKVLKWIRVVCARQPDAEFVFVATKKDRVHAADLEDAEGALAILKSLLESVAVIIQEMKRALKVSVRVREESSSVNESPQALPISHLGDPRLATMVKKPSARILVTSCVTPEDVNAFKGTIQDAIVESDRGYKMPEKYSRVLEALLQMREAAAALPADKRLHDTFVRVENMIQVLVEKVNNGRDRRHAQIDHFDKSSHLELRYLDETTCDTILQTLRDLGDVLWYDTIGDELLQNKIILDPLLMIDLVRQVFNHKHTAETMTHDTLKELELWKHLEGTDGMLSMKRVLQHFQLVYPITAEMEADSDLIVPAYWQSNTCAFWMFGGGDLRFGEGVHREDVAVRVHWEFQFVNNYPHTLFDHVVVASYSPFHPRDVGPDWIMYMEKDTCACRLVLKRAHHSHRWIIHVEVLQGHTATEGQVEHVWDCFLLVVTTLEKVVCQYPGVVVSRSAQEDKEGDEEKTRYKFETLRQRSTLSVPSRKWMPPQETWEAYLANVKK